MNSYEFLAKVYDPLMDDIEDEKWSEYLLELLIDLGLKTSSRILETACGTGRITLSLARSGYDVIAVDISEEMLEIAQKKIKESGLFAYFVSGDMKKFLVPKPVSAIVCACDGINYLVKDEDLTEFFKTCNQNLNPGGVLLFDISSYNKLTKTIGNNVFFDDRENMTCLWQNRLLGEKLYMDLTLFVREGQLYHRMDEAHIQRAYKMSEIEWLLKETGFRLKKSLEFLTSNNATEECERIQFIAVKE